MVEAGAAVGYRVAYPTIVTLKTTRTHKFSMTDVQMKCHVHVLSVVLFFGLTLQNVTFPSTSYPLGWNRTNFSSVELFATRRQKAVRKIFHDKRSIWFNPSFFKVTHFPAPHPAQILSLQTPICELTVADVEIDTRGEKQGDEEGVAGTFL